MYFLKISNTQYILRQYLGFAKMGMFSDKTGRVTYNLEILRVRKVGF